ncbi:unnamed protein product [Callosobruchus maculatus]|uniref:Carboxylesterase type B domain-containing protein n=2 Tax=Callosobruchus maculatus TaxID=64391 RepID=A0A653CG93_CALMS|nr:unnamed protein product [Callosobruchus maculatus]
MLDFGMFGSIITLLLFIEYVSSSCNNVDLNVILRNPADSQIKGACKVTSQGRPFLSFTGIPYAEPPIGKRRLKIPEPVRPWNGTFDATKIGNVCLQDPFLQGGFIIGNEDCLVLNVYTPEVSKNSSKLRPVLFWIPGGAFQFGSGVQMFGFGFLAHYDPTFYMDEDIVVVTHNYRLGALGFLTTDDDIIPANLGLRDQNLALRWVIENIDLFGGDPKNIVLAGESVGAGSVCYQLLSDVPEMKAVTGGIMLSASCLCPAALNIKAREKAFDVGVKLGLDKSNNRSEDLLQLLQSVSSKKLLGEAGMKYIPIKTDDGSITMKWSAIYAKDFYPSEPMTEAVDKGRFQKVPLLFGFNSEECLSPMFLEFLPQIKRKAKLWDQDPSNMIQVNLDVRDRLKAGQDMKALYTNTSFSEDLAAIFKFCSDDQFIMGIVRHAESASKHGVPVYMYQLDYRVLPHFMPGIEGLGHVEDMFYYWDTKITQFSKLFSSNYRLISQRMVRLLSNFVKFKKPILKQEELFQNLTWPKFDSQDLKYMTIDVDLAVQTDPRNYSTKRIVWDRHIQEPRSVY